MDSRAEVQIDLSKSDETREIERAIYKGAEIALSKKFCTLCAKPPDERILHFHSSMLGHCNRMLQYIAMEKPNERNTTGVLANFLKDGFMHEEQVMKNLIEAGLTPTDFNKEFVMEQKGVDSDGKSYFFPVVGHTDAVLNGIPLEVKSVKPYSWTKITEHGIIPRWYHAQITSYMVKYNASKAFFIIKNRNTSDIRCIQIPLSITAWTTYLDEVAEILNVFGLGSGTLPRPYLNPDFECRFCAYKTLCWSTLND